jgi:hypothetical protein
MNSLKKLKGNKKIKVYASAISLAIFVAVIAATAPPTAIPTAFPVLMGFTCLLLQLPFFQTFALGLIFSKI